MPNFTMTEYQTRMQATNVAYVAGSLVVALATLAVIATVVFRRQASFMFSYFPFLLLASFALGLIGASLIILAACYEDSFAGSDAAPSRTNTAMASTRAFFFFFGFIVALSLQFSRLWQALQVFSTKTLMRPKLSMLHFFATSSLVGVVPFILLVARIAAYPADQSCGFVLAYSTSPGSAGLAAAVYAYLLVLNAAVTVQVSMLRRKGALVDDAHNLSLTTSFCLLVELAVDLAVRYNAFSINSAIVLVSLALSGAVSTFLYRCFMPKMRRVNFEAHELMAHIRMENDLKDMELETWSKNELPWPLSKRLFAQCCCCCAPPVLDMASVPEVQHNETGLLPPNDLAASERDVEVSVHQKFVTPKELRASYLAEAMASNDANDDDILILRQRGRAGDLLRRSGADFDTRGDLRRSGMDYNAMRRSGAEHARRSAADHDGEPVAPSPRNALTTIAASPTVSEETPGSPSTATTTTAAAAVAAASPRGGKLRATTTGSGRSLPSGSNRNLPTGSGRNLPLDLTSV